MTDAIVSLAFGAIFGLALAAPPGPMNAVIAEESVTRGWHAGFTAGLGAMTADACFLLLALGGAVTVIQSAPAVRGMMVGGGGLLMFYFAYGAVRDADSFVDGRDDIGVTRGFWKALALALTNPYQIAFWLTVGVKLLEPGTEDLLSHVPYAGETLAGTLVVGTGSPTLLVGLFVGIAVWIVGFPVSLVTIGRRVDRFAPAVGVASAALLALFGAWFLMDAAVTLRRLVVLA